jgi:hypothetical protein
MTTVNTTGKQSHQQRVSIRARMVTAVVGLAFLGLLAAPAAHADESANAPVSVTVNGVVTVAVDPEKISDWPWPCPQA